MKSFDEPGEKLDVNGEEAGVTTKMKMKMKIEDDLRSRAAKVTFARGRLGIYTGIVEQVGAVNFYGRVM
ncbi:uncharacterized protein N7511_001430 [Penicillium nucicola]|uniref:uncharacterized protein n=1 Tax=Penicillium nucicola TaxID=1850975 RepID=UPI0025456366|nr:uncharacterized protein N7511_001430 [Penicillium nucicola]KAJ5776419.1 hypothetical protein N7511_001430 [Penicillium nucicola]